MTRFRASDVDRLNISLTFCARHEASAACCPVEAQLLVCIVQFMPRWDELYMAPWGYAGCAVPWRELCKARDFPGPD